MLKHKIHCTVLMLAVTTTLAGCEETDERLVRLSEQSVARQAEQNRQMAQQSQQVAEATRSLVEADARARAELIEAQHQLEAGIQAERGSLDQQRQTLEQDRQSLAKAKDREPIIANAIWSAALLVAVVLPLVLCIYLIRTVGTDEPSHELTELLVFELTSEESPLLPAPAAKIPRPELAPLEPCPPDGQPQA